MHLVILDRLMLSARWHLIVSARAGTLHLARAKEVFATQFQPQNDTVCTCFFQRVYCGA